MRRDAARQIRAGFVALASVAALIHLVGVDNASGRASILARGAGRGGRGDDALRFLGPGARRQLLSSHCAVGQKWTATHCVDCSDGETSTEGALRHARLVIRQVLQRGHRVPVRGCPVGRPRPASIRRRGHISESDGADELQQLYCGTVPGSDGADELQVLRAVFLYCGQASTRISNAKVPCAAGEFQALAGQTSCEDCAAGKYQDLTGQTSCKNCCGQYFVPRLPRLMRRRVPALGRRAADCAARI